MVFLKSVKVCGFKSFADGLEIKFKSGLTGIVGPNGSGKSNISDAFRWCLGEASLKSLRSRSSADVIFEGSKQRSAANMAEVILCFDNQNHFLVNDQATIEIKRRVFRTDTESYYAINREQVRLRDVRDLAMDAGIGKGSLAIIGQAQVFRFAEMNSEERRLFFDEAAGISKYKQRKKETIRQLSRTETNLRRVQDLLQDHEGRLPSLKRQSETATKYLKIKTELENIEVQTLVSDMVAHQAKLARLNRQLQQLSSQQLVIKTVILKAETSFNILARNNNELDAKMQQTFTRYEDCLNRLTALTSQRSSPKLELSSATILNQTEIKKKFQSNRVQQQTNELQLNETKTQLTALRDDLRTCQSEREAINQAIQFNQLKKQELTHRLQRQKLLIRNRDFKSRAVASIVRNFHTADGVRGLVKDCFTFEPKYEALYLVALSRRQENIIVESPVVARQLIGFLKTNQLGTATFLPVTTIKPRTVPEATITIVQAITGFLGVGTDFIRCSAAELTSVHRYLLGALLVSKDLVSAEQISRAVNRRFTVATLQGDLIYPFGSIFGGSLKTKLEQPSGSAADLEKKLEVLSVQNTQQLKKLSEIEVAYQRLTHDIEMCQRQFGYCQALAANLASTAQTLQQTYRTRFNAELVTTKEEKTVVPSTSETNLINLKSQIQKLKLKMASQRTTKQTQTDQILQLEIKLKNHRDLQQKTAETINHLKIDINRMELEMSGWQDILLRDYELTFASARARCKTALAPSAQVRRQIKQLRWQLKQIGSFNPAAIESYRTLKTKTDQLKTDYEQTWNSLKKLVNLIKELDEKMKGSSQDFIAQVNSELKTTFSHLLGAGFARINFENASEIISSGITIVVQPPGKKIRNINLLSGGEKTLVALAVLFAILKVRPLPLVFLDEVEASLDPANANRVGKYLKTFTNRTQFIVITHRIETMEYCDQLYGTTMAEKGVTKLVGVELQQAKVMLKK